MNYKKGGGNKPELYNEENGRYSRNPICIEDEKNLVLIKLFGLPSKKDIAFPIKGTHDLEYCNLQKNLMKIFIKGLLSFLTVGK